MLTGHDIKEDDTVPYWPVRPVFSVPLPWPVQKRCHTGAISVVPEKNPDFGR